MAILIIFVDSLRADAIAQMPFLSQMPVTIQVRPGFGYSINLHAELFAGMQPDDVGFFCEWYLAPDQSPGRNLRPLLPILDKIFRPYLLNRLVQYLLIRGYRPDHPLKPNIPLRHVDKFAIAGEPIFSPRFPAPTLFTRYTQLYVLKAPKGSRSPTKGKRDVWVVNQALSLLDRTRYLFLSLGDMDSLTHNAGVGSETYKSYLRQIDNWLKELHERFRHICPEGHFFVISDHGMANVKAGVKLELEHLFGPSSLKTFIYFTDSTLLRIWVFDEGKSEQLADYLHEFPYGKLISSHEREQYGLTSPAFGDYILVLDEGYCFEPSYFARHIPAAMHGYHPELTSQQALFAYEGPRKPDPRTLLDIYALLDTTLSDEAEG